jgi:hypothetical protein
MKIAPTQTNVLLTFLACAILLELFEHFVATRLNKLNGAIVRIALITSMIATVFFVATHRPIW